MTKNKGGERKHNGTSDDENTSHSSKRTKISKNTNDMHDPFSMPDSGKEITLTSKKNTKDTKDNEKINLENLDAAKIISSLSEVNQNIAKEKINDDGKAILYLFNIHLFFLTVS